MSKPVTRQDVALAAGVSVFTVSEAVRGGRRVAPATARRVLAVAERLGYHPNSAASLLARQRKSPSQEARLVIARFAEDFHPEFAETAKNLNIDLRQYRPSEFDSPENASRILWNRGVDGLILGPARFPWDENLTAGFQWGRFSVAKISRGLSWVPCHLVRHSPFDYMAMTLEICFKRGYRQACVILQSGQVVRDEDARYGALLNFRERRLPPGARLSFREVAPALLPEEMTDVLKWLDQERPDVVIVLFVGLANKLMEAGWKRKSTGLATVFRTSSPAATDMDISGCELCMGEHYHRVLRILFEMIGRGERGFPENPVEHVVEPVWHEGTTLPEKG